ncbi:ABC transporter substrate-binding protein [Microbacterium oleivorans]|uniref:ABC transporter substrate-binding protein n=1 Tax=Microbacterium oleivorans TaxID=273677 RepID=UPI00080E7876|nr:extracellular solute-binding protein [Microbacterium oleivorans]
MKSSRTIRSAAVIAAAVGALVLAGCSSSPGGDSKDVTLEFVQSGDAAQGGGYAMLAKKYEKETGVKVKVVEVPSDDLRTRLRTASQANDLPALAAAPDADPAWTSRMLDLTDIAEDAKVLPALRVEDPEDGKVKALPTTLTGVGMFLNKTLWDKAGVEFPTSLDQKWTWDEYVQKATEVVDKTDAEYGAVMDSSAHRLRAFMFEFGSQGVTEQADGTWALDAEGEKALEYFKKLNDDGFMPKAVWAAGDDPSATFKSGRVAGYMSGVWQIADFQANIKDFEWVSVPLPQQPVRSTNYGAASWIVAYDGTGVEKQTLDFVKWMYQPENYKEYCEISGCLPAVEDVDITYAKDAYAFDLYNGEIAESPEIAARQTVDGLKNSYTGLAIDSEPLKDETIKYLNGEQTLEQTVKAIDTVSTEQMK